jgi:hypothetical protein
MAQRIRDRTQESSSYSPKKVNEKTNNAAEELTIQDDPEEVGPIDDEEEDGVGMLGELDLYTAQDIAIINGDG